jgi:uroporphyrin-III C-methyltransferase
MRDKPNVYLVGAGPGSADLLTVRAARILSEAKVIIHDALVSQEVLALAANATLINAGKRLGQSSARQEHINTVVVAEGLKGKLHGHIVVRLKGGDPLIFARAEEEMLALEQAELSYEIVSGISSAQAAHASIRLPMTRRGMQRNFVLATPQVQCGDKVGVDWARPIVAAGAGAIYMAASAATRIKGCLLSLGLPRSTSITWVADAGAEHCRVEHQTLGKLNPPLSLKSLIFDNAQAPMLLLIGTHALGAHEVAHTSLLSHSDLWTLSRLAPVSNSSDLSLPVPLSA